MTESTKQLFECLACGSISLDRTLDLGDQPLANNFLEHAIDLEERYPLAVNMCRDCHHLQLTHAVDPAIIYRNYLYVSGTSRTYLDYMDWYAQFVLESLQSYSQQAGPYSVLDIGCNDGSQLDAFASLGFVTHGVDPAENLHPISSGKGHRVMCGFWDRDIASMFGGVPFDIITSQNAFAHIPDPLSYLRLVKQCLSPDGLMFISTSQADMIPNDEFDTIYHEHISFFNVDSMRHLAERAGLYLIDAIKTPIHGTSYVFILAHRPRNKRVDNIIAMERTQGLYSADTYRKWATNTKDLVKLFRITINSYREQGYIIGGYGAAAKGNTLLNFAEADMDFIIDDNPLKQGRFSPGRRIPVVGIDHLDRYNEQHKILFIPLAWNFFTEIRNKITERRSNPDDRFMRYFPDIEVTR